MNKRPDRGNEGSIGPLGKVARALALAGLVVALPLAISVAVLIALIHIEQANEPDYERGQKLSRINWALRMSGYPPMASGDAAFGVDLKVFLQCLKSLPPHVEVDEQGLSDYLAGKAGVEVCYLGHLVASDSAAHLLLDEYVDKGIGQVKDSDIDLDHAFFHGRTCRPTRTLRRLTRSPEAEWALYERGSSYPFMGDTSLDDEVTALLPVLWELPNETDPPSRQGGWVVFRNGDFKWKPYPGEFPMTEEFVRRIREMRSMPPADWKKARARLAQEFSEAERIRQAIRPFQETRFLYGEPAFFSWALAHLDRQPSVELDGHKGYRVVLRNESFKWYEMHPAKLGSRAVNESFRWHEMYRAKLDPGTVIELVAFPLAGDLPIGLEQQIPWRWQREDDQACAVDLGQGAGYRWFGRAAPPWLGFVQERLALTGGSGYLDEFVAWWTQNKDDIEMSRWSLGALARHGAAAISFLEEEIERPRIFTGYMWALIGTLELMPDPSAGELLVRLYNSEDKEVCEWAEWTLLYRPRPEGKAVYLDMLRRKEYPDQGPYIGKFGALARAAAQFGGPEARPLLQELCAHSNESVASLARVALLERPIPEGLVGMMGAPAEAEPVPDTTAHDGIPTFTLNARGDLGEGSCLDLDTGRIFEAPVSVAIAEDPAVTREWLRDNGVDAVLDYIRERDTWGLTLLDLRALSKDGPGWEHSASDVMASLQRAPGAPSDVREEVERTAPVVRLFETGEGASGVFRAGPFQEEWDGTKNVPEPWIRFSYKLVDGGPAPLSPDIREADANTQDQTPEPPTPQYLIGITRRAILEYAQAHERQWPDSLEEVLAGGYLTVPDPHGFLAEFEYIKPWISLEELEGVSPWWNRPEYQVYQTVIVVMRKQDPVTD